MAQGGAVPEISPVRHVFCSSVSPWLSWWCVGAGSPVRACWVSAGCILGIVVDGKTAEVFNSASCKPYLVLSYLGLGYPGASVVKNLSADAGVPETQVRFLGWEDPLEKEMATYSIFLPGKFHGQRSLAGYSPWGHKRVRHD